MPVNILRVAAIVELASLAVLLTNLATVHVAAVASLLGPIHGCAYLFVIGTTWHLTRSAPTTLLGAVPVLGGVLALRRLRHPEPRG
ncbi:DUF3817 domain-containing protein [Dactylosporangium sp. CA-233914]|uniref:DUF3817 domain-containing protein n=1 Tax=Dactylosporangium sp. CA-233914 TaxID=3239934 RepID=UPI003D8C4313